MAIVITTNDGATQKQETFSNREEVLKSAVQPEAQKDAPAPEKKTEVSATEESGNNSEDKSLDYLNSTESDSDESDDDLGEDDTEEESEVEKPKKNGLKKRFDKLTKEKSELKSEIEQLKAMVEKIANNNSNKDAPQKQAVEETKEPVLDDYDDYAAYLKALTKFQVNEERKELNKKADEEAKSQAEAKTHKEAQEILAKYNEKVEEAKKFYGVDNWEKVKTVNAPATWIMQQEILESDIGPHITFYLANNAEECKEICSLTPNKQIRRIAEIEKKLAEKLPKKSNEEAKDKTSKAPNPVKPIDSSKTAGKPVKDLSQTNNFQDFKRLREEQLKKK